VSRPGSCYPSFRNIKTLGRACPPTPPHPPSSPSPPSPPPLSPPPCGDNAPSSTLAKSAIGVSGCMSKDGEGETVHDGCGATTGGELLFSPPISLGSFQVVGRYASNHGTNKCSALRLRAVSSSGASLWDETFNLLSSTWSSWKTVSPGVLDVAKLDIVSRPGSCYPSFRNIINGAPPCP